MSARAAATIHTALGAYLERTGAEGVFARWVVARRPHATSLAVVSERGVSGLAVAGRDHGLPEAHAHWLFADDASSAASLASGLDRDTIAVSYPVEYEPEVVGALGDGVARIGRDLVYLLAGTVDGPPYSRAERLSAASLARVIIAPELRPMLGDLRHWGEQSHLCGIVDDGELVCIAESAVRDAHYAAIQQVYTVAARRCRGLAAELVAFAAADVVASGRTPIYVVDETNTPSIRLAERLGFELHSTWGTAESAG